MDRWEMIPEFPGYSVSDQGQVRNDRTGRVMVLSRNHQGIVKVGLIRGYTQYSRSVTVLVARAFLPDPIENFDTPINLDGDRSNNTVENLMWRPRWFAVMFHKQFKYPGPCFLVPIRDKKTGEVFEGSRDAAVKYGLLEKEIVIATYNRTYVFPTYQEFAIGEE